MCNGGEPKQAMEKFRNELKNSIIIGDINFIDPLIKSSEINREKAISWVKSIAEQFN